MTTVHPATITDLTAAWAALAAHPDAPGVEPVTSLQLDVGGAGWVSLVLDTLDAWHRWGLFLGLPHAEPRCTADGMTVWRAHGPTDVGGLPLTVCLTHVQQPGVGR